MSGAASEPGLSLLDFLLRLLLLELKFWTTDLTFGSMEKSSPENHDKKSLFFQSIGTTDLSVNIDKSVTTHSSFAHNFSDVVP